MQTTHSRYNHNGGVEEVLVELEELVDISDVSGEMGLNQMETLGKSAHTDTTGSTKQRKPRKL